LDVANSDWRRTEMSNEALVDSNIREQVETCVRDALASFGADADQITMEATLASLDIDSLDVAELTQIVDEEFGVKINGQDVRDLGTVGETINLVVSRLK
jgi:acyl carrier protein